MPTDPAQVSIDSLIEKNKDRLRLSVAKLMKFAILNKEADLSITGALVANTGVFTGRSPKDKFIVKDDKTADLIHWGAVNKPISSESFDLLLQDMLEHASKIPLYIQELYVGMDETERKPVRTITEFAWHSLFAQNLFVNKPWEDAKDPWTVIDLPSMPAVPERHGSLTNTMIALDFSRRIVLIANTAYAGEIKKSLFSVMNCELPEHGVFPMHCSANHDQYGHTALFFGLSGTGKTTLSADSEHVLVGDDEHGWNHDGVFNFEGGCYAKTVDLSAKKEPVIYAATNQFGAVLENVVINERGVPNYADTTKTENTRSAYPLSFVANGSRLGKAPHPQNIFFLTADASGVFPPISKLDADAAIYHFLSGYTSKLAGTERGVVKPEATFSTCFGSPFLPLPPGRYAELLREKLQQHDVKVWLINTGWQGGGYGFGKRIDLAYTRAMIAAARLGELDEAPLKRHPILNLEMVIECADIPFEVLSPEESWQDKEAYAAETKAIAQKFVENFKKFEDQVSPAVIAAGPRLS